MTTGKRLVLVLLAGCFFIGFSCGTLCAEPRIIKGFYIGMSIDDALKNFERLGFKELSVRDNTFRKTSTYHTIQPGSGDPFKISTGLDSRTVSEIVFSGSICDRLFHTRGIGTEIFKDRFMAAYDIHEMTPYRDNPGAVDIKGWEFYDLEDGCRVRIFLNKDLEIIQTAREQDFTFD